MPTHKEQVQNRCALIGDGVVMDFENRFKALLENRFHILSFNNATSALECVLRILPGCDFVALPLFTSPSTYAAAAHADKCVLFCDIDPVSVCLSPSSVQDRAHGPLSAILTVNIFGLRSNLKKLRKVADRLDAVLIVDAAQSLATCLSDPDYTALADIVVFSCGMNKFLACPDGAVVAVKSRELWENLVGLSQHVSRQILDAPLRPVNHNHWNFRVNPTSAQVALGALKNINDRITRVQQEQHQQLEELRELEGIELVPGCDRIVFEPLTAITKKQKLPGQNLGALPIPIRLDLAYKYNLPETLRQFRFRKTLTKKEGKNLKDIHNILSA